MFGVQTKIIFIFFCVFKVLQCTVEPAFICSSVCVQTISNINIIETFWPIAIKFYLKHHLGVGKAALGFKPYQIRTVVSMATDSPH